MKLIVGLGNPGDKFIHTRHNLGFEVLEELRRKLEFPNFSLQDKFKAEITQGSYPQPQESDQKLILARPITFMNLSGLSISKLVSYFKVDSEDIVIVHDELDLKLDHIKVKLGGSGAGHHGIENIIKELGTEDFIRIRMGIGNQEAILGEHKKIHFNAEQYVLDKFTPHEKSKVKAMLKRSVKATETLLEEGVAIAMNQFN